MVSIRKIFISPWERPEKVITEKITFFKVANLFYDNQMVSRLSLRLLR